MVLLINICCNSEDFELIRLLIEIRSRINQRNEYGWSLLIFTIKDNKNINISKHLIEFDSYINLSNNGWLDCN